MTFRTDRNNNPIAFTTDVAREAGLVLGLDYTVGDSFTSGINVYHTAALIGDPIATCLKVINKLTFYTGAGNQRWTYIGIFPWLWAELNDLQKVRVLKGMYQREGGTELMHLFPPVPLQVELGSSIKS